MTQLAFDSPAKLNLMLHITGRRDDGYHLLQTVFQFIDLCDRIVFTNNPDGEVRLDRHNSPVAANDDLLLRAANLLRDRYRVTQGVTIDVDKRIPLGAGLGGGSSDAATCLMALNQLWDLRLTNAELRQLGLELGADVPIFIFGRNAWAEGVGDRLQAIDLPEKWYLVVHPAISVSTAQIFAAKDLTRDCAPIKIRAFLEGGGANVCQPVARGLYPQIGQTLDWLGQFGVARMTGTGACVFAAFDSEAEATRVQTKVPSPWNGYVARSLTSNPVTDACFAG